MVGADRPRRRLHLRAPSSCFPRPILTLVVGDDLRRLLGLVVYATAGVLHRRARHLLAPAACCERETVHRLAGDGSSALGKLLREHGMVAVFGANMLPTPPFVVQNMIAGAVRIPLWKFMLGTFLALIPGMLAWTVFGEQMSASADRGVRKVSYWLIGAAPSCCSWLSCSWRAAG